MVREEHGQRVLAERALVDELEVVEEHALLVDRRGERRHRARRRAADIGVVAARGDAEEDLRPVVREHRRHDRDVGQVRAAIIGRVQCEDVAGAHLAPFWRMIASTERSMEPRCTGMCGALATRSPVGVEHRAGEVEPLLDVDRIGRVLQRHAHLLGDRHEEVVEDLEHDRVDVRAERGLGPKRLHAGEHDVVELGHLRPPARLDDDGLRRLDDDRRA